ncbi:hypothetical protein BH24ACT5_BH24ACT5_06910 [soil metagenome]
MRWLRRPLWRPFAVMCRLIPLVPLTVTRSNSTSGSSNCGRRTGSFGCSDGSGYPYPAVYVIDGEVMIDSGFPWARRALRRHLHESGLAGSIHTLLITHEHFSRSNLVRTFIHDLAVSTSTTDEGGQSLS